VIHPHRTAYAVGMLRACSAVEATDTERRGRGGGEMACFHKALRGWVGFWELAAYKCAASESCFGFRVW